MSATDAARPQPRLELTIGGMTCASCAARVEKKLNRLEGVEASVNYATEKATVFAPAGYDPARLVAQVESAGYTAALPAPPSSDAEAAEPSADHELAALRRRLFGGTALALPVVLLSMAPALQFAGWQWVALALATPVVVWGAWPFHRAAAVNLRHGAATMDTLISLGVSAAFVWSLYALVFGGAGEPGMSGAELYLEVAAGVTVFVLAGRYLEKRSKRRAGAALRALLESGAKEASVLRPASGSNDAREERIPVDRLIVGDVFVVRPGERIATDGIVTEGTGAVDASMLTGESVPVEVEPGAAVAGGTINSGGRLVVRATQVGADTRFAQIARLVEDAQSGKAAAQRLADRISAVFVPVVIGLAVVTLIAWLLLGFPAEAAFTAAVAVLIIACPCALGLATPTALLVGTGRGAQLGILITGPEVLEATRRVDTVLLDKTGTVTTGRMALAEVTADGDDPSGAAEALRRAGAVEDASEHPIARAIADAARGAGDLPPVSGFRSDGGLGVSATVEGEAVVVGRASFVTASGMPLGPDLQVVVAAAEASGRTAVVVGWGGRARAVLAVADTVAPHSAEAVRRLRRLGLAPVLLTGDNETVARRVAQEVGIDTVIAGVLPAEKAEVVRRLQAEGRRVAMVGDGVNDAAALAAADLGLAMGTGTDAAIQAADLTLVRGELTAAADAVRLSRRTLATIHGNLFWAFAYNLAALPLAAFGLLNPMIAGAAMAFSSVFVVGNSLRLRSFRPLAVAGATSQAPEEGRIA
ncbi:carbonate dehydratase [Leifsonia sp. Leaf336]|uniref:heavy metal translocating P-type ATPase n=1 Tax=Leifsonia sp. Leaf336 TaxID=1736341 RepID=UPI0006F7E33A|nr:heavy metal translocating P-type ATPase [Leifsonia sp. Leaf336]KQR54098.1 carbonate dehydratase [Leifsonia sp. Leaf336]